MSQPITILTSIFPARLEVQQKAVASWLDLGFSVVSVNIASELEVVEPFFAGVNFIAINRPMGKVIGSRIFLDEIFSVIQTLPGRVYGIVNSDICLEASNSFHDFILDNADDSLIYGSRIDVDSFAAEYPTENPFGYDYFFFNREILSFVSGTEFCLGMPVWDYWLPIAGAVSGYTLRRLITPVAIHEKHDDAWTEKEYDSYWPKFQEAVQYWLGSRVEVAPVWTLLSLIGNDWRDCSHFIRWYLHCQPEIIYYPDNVGTVLLNGQDIFSRTNKDLLGCLSEVAVLRQQLNTIFHSRSWKLTAPLRWGNKVYEKYFRKQ